MLDRLKRPEGSRKKPKRVGRGEASGWGRCSGRGNKGQRSRSGGGTKAGFEGGQMPLQRRLPKRGFTNIFRTTYSILNVETLSKKFAPGDTVDIEALAKKGLVKKKKRPVKVLGSGDISIPLTVKVKMFTKSARAKIEAAGGKAEVV
jgi:large subunit ribosomal protein L15